MSTPLPITIDIANHPIEIKITSNHYGMLGTLCLNEEGLSFKRPNMKKESTIIAPWDKFDNILGMAVMTGMAKDNDPGK